MTDYIGLWKAGELSDTEVLQFAAQELSDLEAEFAPAVAQAKYAENLRKGIRDDVRPAMDRLLTSAPSVLVGGVRFTKTNPQPKAEFDAVALSAFMDELASYGGGEIAVSYILQRLAEAKTTKAASVAYKAEIVREK